MFGYVLTKILFEALHNACVPTIDRYGLCMLS